MNWGHDPSMRGNPGNPGLLLFGGFLDGSHQVLDVAARVAFRPLVQFFSPPLGLFAGGEPAHFLLTKRQTL